MKRLKGLENDDVSLEVFECDCGFHIGLDATFLDSVCEVKLKCPSCDRLIDTEILCKEQTIPCNAQDL